MAYVAITCLMNTIQQSIQVTACNLQSSYKKLETLRAIQEKPRGFVIGNLEALTSLEAEIARIAVWKLRFLLKRAVGSIDSTMKQWIGMLNRYTNSKDLKAQNLTLASTSQHVLEPENMMVGHEKEFEMMQDQLTRGESDLEVVLIVGMGGIATSQEYCARNVLLSLLYCTSGKTDESHEQRDDGQLADQLQKLLKGKRYLVVIDDIWTTGAWVKSCFPDCNCGSRIILTTRNVEVAEYASSSKPPYHMRLMNFDESWDLLHRKVFEKECPSPDFEKNGKQIALKCGGLPLAITVITGLLSKIDKTLDEWQSVSENVSSVVSIDLEAQCMRVLALSYHHLPFHLKPCFLYFAIFPEDQLIFVDKLVELWAVEGFLKVEEMKSIEEVAETCLNELIDRNLISINNFSFDGKVKSCGMHDVIRELCLREARNMNFVNIVRESMHFPSMSRGRISIQYVMFKHIVEKMLVLEIIPQ
ncbi:hypothetical protein HAX54_015072 [Datura stramonium]|uniref:NB-ARC domain-containing protein n=1 Tax=Datura stramonium TaxID=4076 RepID=A0ABS8TP00_DATST|nr:hypothetical protein [Datura stramonium]